MKYAIINTEWFTIYGNFIPIGTIVTYEEDNINLSWKLNYNQYVWVYGNAGKLIKDYITPIDMNKKLLKLLL